MDIISILIGLVVGLVIGLVIAYTAYQRGRKQSTDEGAVLRLEATKTLEEAQTKARQHLVEGKDEVLKLREAAERDIKTQRRETQEEEARLKKIRVENDQNRERNEQREKKLKQREQQLDKMTSELENKQKERLAALEKVAAMTKDDARAELIAAVRDESRNDMARVIREVEAQAKETADQKARKVVLETIQRVATDTVAEKTVSTIVLPAQRPAHCARCAQ